MHGLSCPAEGYLQHLWGPRDRHRGVCRGRCESPIGEDFVTEQPCWEGGGCPGKSGDTQGSVGVGFLRLWTCGETPLEMSILAS